jgi:hypothetical protein
MDRRQALAVLTGLPAVAAIQAAEVKPEDVIVVECDKELGPEQASIIERQLLSVWPNRRVVVFPQGIRMRIVKASKV